MKPELLTLLKNSFNELLVNLASDETEGKAETIAYANGEIHGILLAAEMAELLSPELAHSLTSVSLMAICKGTTSKEIEAILDKCSQEDTIQADLVKYERKMKQVTFLIDEVE